MSAPINDNEMHNYLVEIRKMQNVLMKKMQDEEKANKEAIQKEQQKQLQAL